MSAASQEALKCPNWLPLAGRRLSHRCIAVENAIKENIQQHFESFKSTLSDVVIGILKEGMDLVNKVIILGRSYLWSLRHKDIKPSISHSERILE